MTKHLKNSYNIQCRQLNRKRLLVHGSVNSFSPLFSFCSRNLLGLPKFKAYIFFDSIIPLLRISPTKIYFKNVHCKVVHSSRFSNRSNFFPLNWRERHLPCRVVVKIRNNMYNELSTKSGITMQITLSIIGVSNYYCSQ